MKNFGDVPIFTQREDNLGSKHEIHLGFIDPLFKYLIAILELGAGALLLFGQRVKGGALSVVIIGGAILTHLFVICIFTPESSAPDAALSPILFIIAVRSFLVAIGVTKPLGNSFEDRRKLPR